MIDAQQAATRRSAIVAAFEGFRDELDEHNDRRERIIKTNRDITNLSKKLIFQLHRIAQDEGTQEGRAAAIGRSKNKFTEVQKLYERLQEDVAEERGWKYARSVSGGLQELIEALSLRHYLLHGEMISFAQVQQYLTSDTGIQYVELSHSDYLLGISDLTGELMRLAISTITKRGGKDRALHISNFVRKCIADFETFTPHTRDLVKKQNETASSLRKIEDALYTIRIREYEYGEGSFDEVLSHFTPSFDRPAQPSLEDERYMAY
ncbi:Translin [Ceratobasidium sp. AG-I]|nr:Translin [Ceratobasidium sp. AG-I]